MKRLILVGMLLISGFAQAQNFDSLIETERRNTEARMNLLESMDRDRGARDQREALRTQRELNQLQTMRVLGGQAPVVVTQPGLPLIRY